VQCTRVMDQGVVGLERRTVERRIDVRLKRGADPTQEPKSLGVERELIRASNGNMNRAQGSGGCRVPLSRKGSYRRRDGGEPRFPGSRIAAVEPGRGDRRTVRVAAIGN